MKKGNLKGIKAVIFDLDGTIIDSLSCYLESLNEVILGYGLKPISREKLSSLLSSSKPLAEILKDISPIFLDPERNRKAREEVLEVYIEKQKSKVDLLPGVREVFEALREKGIKIGIVTGRTVEGEMKYLELERLGVRDFIDCLITAKESERKPSPYGILRCLEELKVSPSEAFFVGDSLSDVEAGKSAGVRTVAVLTGVGLKEQFVHLNPDFVIEDLRQLLALIV